jgi:hypothetical protein
MANNLHLVVATCEKVNPMQLFNQEKCPLSQSVLLSLIQQLGEFKNWPRPSFCAMVFAIFLPKIGSNILYYGFLCYGF